MAAFSVRYFCVLLIAMGVASPAHAETLTLGSIHEDDRNTVLWLAWFDELPNGVDATFNPIYHRLDEQSFMGLIAS